MVRSRLGATGLTVWFLVSASGAVSDPPMTNTTVEAGIMSAYLGSADDPSFILYLAGGAVFDADDDGHTDIFVLGSSSSPDKLYINNGDGTFTDRAAESGLDLSHIGSGAVVGDYDADGDLDLFVTSFGADADSVAPGNHILYRNNGDGTFTDVAGSAGVSTTPGTKADGFGAAFGDIDLDGDLDLVVAQWREGNDEFDRVASSGIDPFIETPGAVLFVNNGDGTFTENTQALGFGDTTMFGLTPALVDMNGDRYPELLLSADFGTSRYFINNTDGTFTMTSREGSGLIDTNGMGAVVADITGDGLADWFVSNICCQGPNPELWGGQNLFENQGDDSFIDIAPLAGLQPGEWAWGTDAVDIDNDTDLDLPVVNGWPSDTLMNNRMFRNNGDGTFTDIAPDIGFASTFSGRGLSTFDYDADGDLDFVVFNHKGPALLFRNDLDQSSGANHLRIDLDTKLRPDLAPNGFGARITLTAGGVTQVRFIDGAPTYLAVSELTEHFGLGAATTVDEIRVLWNDGSETVLGDVAAGQTITIEPPLDCLYADLNRDGAPDWGSFDIDGDGAVDVDDMYALTGNMSDVNGDGSVDAADGACLERFVRRSEILGLGLSRER